MYDPKVGQFLSIDPIEDDQENLYRYVGNSPINYTDPTGLERDGLDPWGNNGDDFDEYSIDPPPPRGPQPLTFPYIAPGTTKARLVKFTAKGTPAEVARADLRLNLRHYKTDLVNDISMMLANAPPTETYLTNPEDLTSVASRPIRMTAKERADVANMVADAYIEGVDDFLTKYFGAKPELAPRMPWTKAEAAPYCADWASETSVNLQKFLISSTIQVGGIEVRLSSLLKVQHLQHQPGVRSSEHNFAGLAPVGHKFVLDPLKDPIAVYLDPWFDLRPRIYNANTHHGILPTHENVQPKTGGLIGSGGLFGD